LVDDWPRYREWYGAIGGFCGTSTKNDSTPVIFMGPVPAEGVRAVS
jgi:hypothetical protein